MTSKYIQSYAGQDGNWVFGADILEEFLDIEVGFDGLDADINSAVKISGANAAGELPTAATRAGKLLQFKQLPDGTFPPAAVDPGLVNTKILVPISILTSGSQNFTGNGQIVWTTVQGNFSPYIGLPSTPFESFTLGPGQWSLLFMATMGNPAGASTDLLMLLEKGSWTTVKDYALEGSPAGPADWGNWTGSAETVNPFMFYHQFSISVATLYRYSLLYGSGAPSIDVLPQLLIVRRGDP